MTPPARLIIADPGLRTALGHHLGYTLAVAEAARRRGIAPVVLASARFGGGLPEGIDCRPSFASAYQSAGGGGRARALLFGAASYLPGPLAGWVAPPLRALRRRLHRTGADWFGAELAAALAGLGDTRADLVLLHSVSASNLVGLETAVAGRLALVLRRTPAEMDRDDAGPLPVAVLLNRLAGRLGGRLWLAADTVPLAGLWAAALGHPVAVAPLPVVAPPVRTAPPGAPPHLVFAGGARAEKGYGLLPGLVAALAGQARFTIHSGPIGAADDPLVQRAHRRLRAAAGPGLTLLEHPLPPDDYLALLRAADLLLLPYDPAAYGPRSSGILAEARAMGVPAVVPAGRWMEQAAGPEPALVFATPAGFAPCVRAALARLPVLLAGYAEAAPAWRAQHSPAALLAAILG